MNYGRAVATNTLWMVGGKVLTTLLSLILTAALARSLGVFQFGEFTTAFAFISLFGVIADFGFFQILIRDLARQPDQEAEISGTIVALRATFGVLVYGLAAGLVWFFPYSSVVKGGVVLLAGASFVLSTNTTLIGIFQARHQMIKAVVGEVVSRAVLLGAVLMALSAGWGLVTIFSFYIGANLVNLLITLGFVRRWFVLRPRVAWDRWRYYLREAWPLGIVAMLAIVYFKIGTIILSVLRGSVDVGIYGAPFKIFELLTIIPGIFMGNVLPVVIRVAGETDRQRRIVQGSLETLLILGIGTAVGLVVLARPIIGLVAGPDFVTASTVTVGQMSVTAVEVLQLLAVALVAIFLAHLWGYLIIAAGRQRELIPAGLIAVAVTLVGNWLLIPRFSYVGAALVTIVTEGLILVLWQRIARRVMPALPTFRPLGRIMLAGGLMAAVVWPLREGPIVLSLLAGGLTYLVALFGLGAVPNAWTTWLPQWSRR